MKFCVLDSDAVSELMRRKNARIDAAARSYFRSFGHFTFSLITWYEVIRGFRADNSSSLLARFLGFSDHSQILPVTLEVLDCAANLWVAGHNRRNRTHDADLIIAATALTSGATLVTGNEKDFDWIEGLSIANWRVGG